MCYSFLPKPKAQPFKPKAQPVRELSSEIGTTVHNHQKTGGTRSSSSKRRHVPAYGKRKSTGFVPRTLDDFGDGGAYPEIHVAQFPLHMGRKDRQSSNLLALSIDREGESNFTTAIANAGHSAKKKVYSTLSDMVEKRVKPEELERPGVDEARETAAKTSQALAKLISGKVKSSQPLSIARHKTAEESSSYYRYTPNPEAPGYNPKIAQRVIRMVDAPVDPMEPPKFMHKKAPRGPPSPPVPILHSPPRKISVVDQQNWKIPPCISNWKNIKGYTIALDKRLATDGRGLQEVTINDQFASLSEALSIAERKAREEVNTRAQVAKKLILKEKEQKEQELRNLAAQARMERSGFKTTTTTGCSSGGNLEVSDFDDDDSEEEQVAQEGRHERDNIRRERKREREREMRLEKIGKKGKLARDDDRDVSEKIALGQLSGKGAKSDGGLYDARLFNQSQGMDAGFGAEEDYNIYSKALADRTQASSIYRPKSSKDSELYGDAEAQMQELKKSATERFRPDTDFAGIDRDDPGGTTQARRSGPVQFEKELEDPFGLDQFLTEARSGKRGAAMDAVGQTSTMLAGSGTRSRESYAEDSSSKKKMKFQSAGHE